MKWKNKQNKSKPGIFPPHTGYFFFYRIVEKTKNPETLISSFGNMYKYHNLRFRALLEFNFILTPQSCMTSILFTLFIYTEINLVCFPFHTWDILADHLFRAG